MPIDTQVNNLEATWDKRSKNCICRPQMINARLIVTKVSNIGQEQQGLKEENFKCVDHR